MEHRRITDRKTFRAGGQQVAALGHRSVLRIVFSLSASVFLVTGAIQAGPPDRADFEKYRVIVERNMFAPHRATESKPDTAAQIANEPDRPDIRVVGIVRMSDPYSSIAIIANGGRHRLCRVGDSIGPMILRSIREQDIVFETPSGHWLAEIEPGAIVYPPGTMPQFDPTVPGFVAAPQQSGSGARRRLPVRAVEIRQLARAGLVVYRENGAVRGLQLTRDALGLKQGDRVTHVDGQALCTRRPRQKLWQIVRKHSASKERGAEIHVVVERNDRTLEFLVTPIG